MAAIEEYIRLETPWVEPEGFKEPTSEQLSAGVVVWMLASSTGPIHTLHADAFYLLDPAFAARLVERGRARYETDRERKCAEAVGLKRPKPGVKASPAKGKSKGG